MGQDQFGEPAKFFQIGVHHFAFRVDDVDDVIARAARAGITPFRGPMEGDDIGMGELGQAGTVRRSSTTLTATSCGVTSGSAAESEPRQ
jgi:hypothetical protein